MIKKIKLHFANDTHRGPGKVVRNLSEGLRALGLLAEDSADQKTFHGFLQYPTEDEVATPLSRNEASVNDYLFGPNLVVLPSEISAPILRHVRNMVVPSQWVKDLYRRFPLLTNVRLDVWSVGVDTDSWTPPANGRVRSSHEVALKCVLYVKNRTDNDLTAVQKLLLGYGVITKVLRYGSYEEKDLSSACEWADFGVLLTNTESQGIAYMEMLSTDLPLFVFNYPWWDYDGRYEKVPATSVPYFSEACGVVTDRFDKVLFEEFLGKVTEHKFMPRAYMLENHTLRLSSQRYYDIMARNSDAAQDQLK